MPKLTQLIRRKIWDSNLNSLAPESALPTPRLPCPPRAHSRCSMKAGQYEDKISSIQCSGGLYAWAVRAGRRAKGDMSLGWSGQGWIPGQGGILSRKMSRSGEHGETWKGMEAAVARE